MVFQLYPSRNLPDYTIVLRHERHAHEDPLVVLQFYQLLVSFFSQSQGAIRSRGSVFRKTIDMHLRLFVLLVDP